MSKAKLDKKIVLRDKEKVILCEHDSLLDTYSYYLCSIEGQVIMVLNNCNCEQIPTIYGHDVHSEVEHYFNDGRKELSSEGAKWVVDTMEHWGDNLLMDRVEEIKSEVSVSDFEGTASKVDLVLRTLSGNDVLFDIKTTATFNREYCSLQLSVYKKLYEMNYNRNVTGLFVLGTKSQRAFRIIEQPLSKVEKILGMNKAV